MALNIDFDSLDEMMSGNLRLFISFALGLLVFVGIIALSVFLIVIRGKEEVMVPNVVGKELTQALIELQEKELYPRIQLRLSVDGEERGTILEQEPEPGTLVRAERRINLVISQGAALDQLSNFIGKNINDVRAEVRNVNAQLQGAVISIREPFMYQYAAESVGTILQQNPIPGSAITGNVTLELVVSRGQENARITVPGLLGASFNEALSRLSRANAGFAFTMRDAAAGESPGVVISQEPAGGTEINAGDKILVGVTKPAVAEGEAAGLFRHMLPVNPYPLSLNVDVVLPNGNRQSLVSTAHSGGEFSMPYKLPDGSVIVLSMVDREIHRQAVTAGQAN